MAKVWLYGMFLVRRSYAKVAGNAKENSAASVINKVADTNNNVGAKPVAVQKGEFWMRDPKTGNWMPENHFEEIDAPDLRAKIFSKKTKESKDTN